MTAIGDIIQRYPLLRVLVPYIVGIVLADVLYPHVESGWLYGAAAFVVLCVVLWGIAAVRNSAYLWSMAVTSLFLLSGGVGYLLSRQQTQYIWQSGEAVYEARVADAPRSRARSLLCTMEVVAASDSLGWHRVGRKVLAYMEPCSEAHSLQAGDVVCFKGRVRPPRNFSEELHFDYARYVTMQGAAGTVYLPQGNWVKRDGEPYTLRERLLRLRHSLLTEYMYPTFEGDVLGVLAALVLGDRRELSEEMRRAYSDAGLAHVLALSGLHVGIIYAMLAFLMRGMIRRRSLHWLHEVVVIAVLWLFALMVGMASSVVRAVSMYTLYSLSRWVSRESNSFNVLLLAAGGMLLVYPFYLFDVGFQLSFIAMAAILSLSSRLEVVLHRRSLHPLPAYLVGMVCVSLAAQLGTFPLVLYHFGSFPTYFLLTNLVFVLCLNIVLVLTIVWIVMALIGIPWAVPLGHALQCLVGRVNDLLVCISHWPGAVLNVEGFNAVATLFTYLFILFTVLFFFERWPRGGVLALASLLGVLVALLF